MTRTPKASFSLQRQFRFTFLLSLGFSVAIAAPKIASAVRGAVTETFAGHFSGSTGAGGFNMSLMRSESGCCACTARAEISCVLPCSMP